MEQNAEHQEALPKICSIDQMTVGQSYTFDPPLDIFEILRGGRKLPADLKQTLKNRGLREGMLVAITPQSDGRTIGVFHCTIPVKDVETQATQDITYRAQCVFSPDKAKGIVVDVRQQTGEILRDKGDTL